MKINLIFVLIFICSLLFISSHASLSKVGEVKKESDLCFVCKLVISFAQDFIERNKTEQELENFLSNDVCPLTGVYKILCQDFVNNNLPELITYVINKENYTVACTQLHACTNSSLTTANINNNGENNDCIACRYLIDLSVSILGSNASVSAIQNFLNNVACEVIPNSYTSDCKAIIQANYNQIITSIQQGENGTYACTSQLKICKNNAIAQLEKQQELPQPMKLQAGPSEECTICITVVTLVDYFLGSNKTEEDVEKFLDTVCLVFGDEKDACESVVKFIVQNGIGYIVQNQNASIVCANIGICNNNSLVLSDKLNHLKNIIFNKKLSDVVPGSKKLGLSQKPDCDSCQLIGQNLLKVLGTNPSQVNIENVLTGVCKSLSPVDSGLCEDTLHAYMAQIIQWIKEGVSIADICLRISYC